MGQRTVEISDHYTRGDLGQVILDALEAAGHDLSALTPEALAPVDEFHIRGRIATDELAGKVGLRADMAVLDVGSGIGGPARYLANEYGCRVTGLDLTEEFCRVGTMLTERVGLADRVGLRQGNALDMPFADASFDMAWTQHVAMNIPDKASLYREVHRVVKPGGAFVIYDILSGPGGDVHLPVPWASEAAHNHLATPEGLRATLEAQGWRIVSWDDTTDLAREWFDAVAARAQSDGPPPLGIHLVLGAQAPTMIVNMRRNLLEDRIRVMQIVAERPAAPAPAAG